MKYAGRTFQPDNKKQVRIRMCEEKDAAALILTIKEYLADSPCIPILPEEFVYTVEEEKQWIRKFMEQENSLFLVAEHAGKLIGNIDITGNQRSMLKHTAMIGMGMLKEWRGVGLGTLLMNEAVAWACSNPLLEQLWLEVYAENEAGLRLYRKSGFREAGCYPAFFRHEGKYSDKIMMHLQLK